MHNTRCYPGFKRSTLALSVCLAGLASQAQAAQIDLGDSDWRLRWDNTIKYSQAWRLQGADDHLTNASTAVACTLRSRGRATGISVAAWSPIDWTCSVRWT